MYLQCCLKIINIKESVLFFVIGFLLPLNRGIIDLMNQYGICLAAQNNKKWLVIVLLLDKSLSFNPSSVAHTTCGGWMNEQFLIEYKKVSPHNVFRVLPRKSWRVFGIYESGNLLCSYINKLSGFWLVVFSHLREAAKPSKQLFVTQNVGWNRLMYTEHGKPFRACSTGRMPK